MIKKSIPIVLCMVLTLLVITSCNFRPKPVTIKTYVIDSNVKIPEKLVSKPYPYVLILSPVMGALPLRTQKILYRSSEVTLGPYLLSRWEYPPTHMLMVKMLEAISNSGLFKGVTPRSTGAYGDLYLETTLFDFTQHLSPDGESSTGVISIAYQLIDSKTHDIISTKKFIIKKPTPAVNAEGAALALNAASNELCLKLLIWLKSTLETFNKTTQ